MTRIHALVPLFIALLGCDETPVRFEYCDTLGHCALTAKFVDRADCDFYRQLADCDIKGGTLATTGKPVFICRDGEPRYHRCR